MEGLIKARRNRRQVLDMDALKQTTAEALITATGVAAGVIVGTIAADEIKRNRIQRHRMLEDMYRRNNKGGKKNRKSKKHKRNGPGGSWYYNY